MLFGDAAGAAVVGPGPGAVEIVAATAGTDGSKSDILSAASHQVLEKAGVSMDDAALVVPHQANLRILDAVGKRLDLPDERVRPRTRGGPPTRRS
ncbi:3-oxoacyl-[acyl-carrier-protein] synthase III C-terminal domain-containing protein [Candidatus Palauibacter sp.]|uniref:3-oxoacyl-[acyl-carrier-protein] synthase III C-terminal domain-containing protein n=1 Tax=Candidatus Palauibacter sp. TaxID=3101350 RepID=UPI003B528670